MEVNSLIERLEVIGTLCFSLCSVNGFGGKIGCSVNKFDGESFSFVNTKKWNIFKCLQKGSVDDYFDFIDGRMIFDGNNVFENNKNYKNNKIFVSFVTFDGIGSSYFDGKVYKSSIKDVKKCRKCIMCSAFIHNQYNLHFLREVC